MASMEVGDSAVQNALYYNLTATRYPISSISIKVLQGGQQFDIEINAGSFFSVSNGDTTVLYGDYKKPDRKYFIEGPSGLSQRE